MSSSHVSHLFDLSGKRAVVTGVRRGIGLAIAETLAAAGADIVGVRAHLAAARPRLADELADERREAETRRRVGRVEPAAERERERPADPGQIPPR